MYGTNINMSRLRIGGLATGIDTHQLVSDMMRIQRMPYDRLYQQKQLAEWRRDAFRDVSSLLIGFKSQYFDVLKPATNMRSSAVYNRFSVSSSDESVITATASENVMDTNLNVVVNSIATHARAESTGSVSKALGGKDVESFEVESGSNSFYIAFNGTQKLITIPEGTYESAAAIVGEGSDGLLKQAIKEAFPGMDVVVEGSKIKFTSANASDTISVYSHGESELLTSIGFDSGDSNKIRLTDSMDQVSSKLAEGGILFDEEGKFKLTINGADIEVDREDTLGDVINRINSSSAGVKLTYSQFSDKFTMVSRETGEQTITLEDNGSNFFAVTKLTSVEDGQNANFTINDIAASRRTNTFTIEGVTYTLNKAEPGVVKNITLTRDIESSFDTIKSFVEKYNEIIDTINGKLNEEYDRNYLPLTQEQRDALSEDEIKKWEERASTGLLRNDPNLTSLIHGMRRALYESIKDVDGSLHSIGISTGTYQQRGRLVIDEERLKKALEDHPDRVMNLFAKQSSISYSPDLSSSERSTRYAESGVINRLFDILEDNIRTTRNAEGQKGVLLEKAGIKGDLTEFQNSFNKQISDYEKRMYELNRALWRKEEAYYAQFAALEKAMANMHAQSNWLMAQLSGGMQM